uniref:Xylulose kinase n=1 Tax=Rhizophora mucronata TaxID=61149 RepID=A0A2P2LB23_RHIMU
MSRKWRNLIRLLRSVTTKIIMCSSANQFQDFFSYIISFAGPSID